MVNRVLLLLLLLSTISFYGQEVKLPLIVSKDTRELFVKLPLANQKDSLFLFFDTGAGITMLDNEVAAKYGLKANEEINVSGAGGKKSYGLLKNQRMYLDQTHFMDSVSLITDDLSRLNLSFDNKIDGLIGATILQRYLTKIDIDEQVMSLYSFDEELDYEGYEKFPFKWYKSGKIPEITVSFEMQNGKKYTGTVLFDSGAGLLLLVNTPFKEKNKVVQQFEKKIRTESDNLSNKTTYEKGLIKNISLGSFMIEKENMGISLASDTSGVSSDEEIMGILGSEIIHRFSIILDYQRQLIYLKPNKIYNRAYDAIVNPLKLKHSYDRTEIVISNVQKGTDAERKGLKKGQCILSVNGVKATTLYDYEELLKKENTEATIEYLDLDKKVKKVCIKLSRIL